MGAARRRLTDAERIQILRVWNSSLNKNDVIMKLRKIGTTYQGASKLAHNARKNGVNVISHHEYNPHQADWDVIRDAVNS